jgi:hypothetical protein
VEPVAKSVDNGFGKWLFAREGNAPGRTLAQDLGDHREYLGTLVVECKGVMVRARFGRVIIADTSRESEAIPA